jgi:hypothetical protein
MKAYNAVLAKYPNDIVLDLFSDISASEVMFMAYVDICCRPFKVPVSGTDYVGTDEVLKSMGLGDAYDSYLNKTLPMGIKTPEETIEQATKEDYRVVKTVISSSLDKDIRHYYTMVKNGVPLVTLDNIFVNRVTVSSLGFVSRKREFQHRFIPAQTSAKATALQESFMNPRSEVELRFQVDKIIADMRYAESESEREAILIKIKNLTIKLLKTKEQLDKKLQRNPQDKESQHSYEVVMNLLDELELLRTKTVNMEIKEKRYGVFCQYPAAYSETVTTI